MSCRLNVCCLLVVLVVLSVVHALSAQDPTELKSKAESGDVAAQSSLADAYHSGKEVPKDAVEAVRWWQKAAEKGDLESQVNLGIAYQLGAGVARNYVAAARWYRKAADQGNAVAQSNLAVLY